RETLELIPRTRPDVVVLDLRLPDVHGLECLEEIKSLYPDVTVVVLSVDSAPHTVSEALERGASAYVVKSVNPPDLPATIRNARKSTVGLVGLPDETPASLARAAGLTPREHEILVMVADGRTNAGIARDLSLAPQTVKAYLSRIYRRLHVRNRTL